MSEYGYFDYARDVEAQQVEWASGGTIPFVAEKFSSLRLPDPAALGSLASAKSTAEKYQAAYRYAFTRDFAHRHRTGSSFLLRTGAVGSVLPAAIRAQIVEPVSPNA